MRGGPTITHLDDLDWHDVARQRLADGRVVSIREKWFELRPQIAEKNTRLRIDAIKALKGFRNAYYEAYGTWCAGDHDAEFPFGTWDMRVRFNARVGPAPPG